MTPTRVYFSLSEITNPANHIDHNEWHQLDHRPENLLIPGIAWGDRWVRSPDCAAQSTGSSEAYRAAHYAIMYWFREPMHETLDEFFALSERSFQWGRSPQVGWTRRPMRGFFSPIKGYVAPRTRVSTAALPLRPVKAIHVTLSHFDFDHADAAEILDWEDRVRLPELVRRPGVAGAWTFGDAARFKAAWDDGRDTWGFADQKTRDGIRAPNRMQILYLDAEPDEVLAHIASEKSLLPGANPLVEDVMFASPFRAIVAWEWDWFSGAA